MERNIARPVIKPDDTWEEHILENQQMQQGKKLS